MLYEVITLSFQNMCQNRCATAANILCHTDFCAFNLGFSALTTQLLDDFYDLIHSRCTDRMPTGFQPRITSYNVCYTKLLRPASQQAGRIFRDAADRDRFCCRLDSLYRAYSRCYPGHRRRQRRWRNERDSVAQRLFCRTGAAVHPFRFRNNFV